jgi:nicotinamide-nucleotide amidase
MANDARIPELVSQVARRALAAKHRVVTAESCTGGWIAKAFTDLAESSHWFERGYVTYSNEAKVHDLGVTQETLATHGAVSEATVREMALGALRVSGADVAVSVSGIAGPSGGTPAKPVGTVWFAVASKAANGAAVTRHQLFPGDREAIRRSSVEYALELLLQHALPKPP